MNFMESILLCTVYAVTILLCGYWLVRTIKRIASGGSSAQNYLYLVFFLFYIFPLCIQFAMLLFGESVTFRSFKMADIAMCNFGANLQYSIFVLIVGFLLNCKIKIKSTRNVSLESTHTLNVDNFVYSRTVLNLCTLLVLIPLAYIILSGNAIQLIFSAFGSRWDNGAAVPETLIILCVPAYLAILATMKETGKLRVVLLTVVMVLYFWIVAKRYLIAEVLILAVYTLGISKQVKPKTIVKLLIVATACVLVFCVAYGFFFKQNLNSIMEYFTVDLSRQYTLVHQFYCKQIGREISCNPFDSILYIVLFWIPREIWTAKPFPFVNSLTWSLVSTGSPVHENLGWAATCSIFSELFDSFSYIGLVLGAVAILYICRWINRTSNIQEKIFWIYCAVNLMILQSNAYIIPLVISWIVIKFVGAITKKRKSKSGSKRGKRGYVGY